MPEAAECLSCRHNKDDEVEMPEFFKDIFKEN